MKTFGVTDYTNLVPLKCCGRTDRRTDGRTDGRADGQTDGRPDGRSGPTTRPAFAKATQVTKRYRRTDGQTDTRMDNVKTVYPTTNKVCGEYKKILSKSCIRNSQIPYLKANSIFKKSRKLLTEGLLCE